jgi:uncharacterized protein YbjT (DUF2867 family)
LVAFLYHLRHNQAINPKGFRMSDGIVVTGATGNVGSAVVEELQNLSIPVRVALRNPDTATGLQGKGVEIVPFDFLNPATFAPTFAGQKRLLLVRPPALGNAKKEIIPALEAAVAVGIHQIVFLSVQGAERNRFIPHAHIEAWIRASGVNYTFLRAGFFMQNLATTHRAEIRDLDEIAVPMGTAKTAFVDTRDVAAVAVKAFTQPDSAKPAYTLTGSEALDYSQIAAMLSTELGRTIRYPNPSLFTFIRRQRAAGHPWDFVFVMVGLYMATRFGGAPTLTHDVAQVLGRPPILFEQFARDYREVW